MNLSGKKVIVTGGSHGIGEAIVRRFSIAGADVLFTYKDSVAKAAELCDILSSEKGKVTSLQCDMSDISCCKEILQHSEKTLGKVNTLVNNVGTLTRDTFLIIDEEKYDQVLDTNLKIPFFLTQLVAKRMIEHDIFGNIINVSSLSSRLCRSRVAHYQIAKAGMENLTKSAAYELAEHGIRVNGICPGLTATKANQEQWENQPELWQQRAANIPLKRTGLPQDHAGAALYLASDEASWVTGVTLVIDGGMSLY
ncbi:SDR family NAD(P)-dependent oxidoreductase [Xenorhabdus sp. SGI246]|uniref:SDR family NAD(P)-dependent oxidoreductase n=1 Tax=Xenorhabdus sp. SGI246 TaxID=3158263 RepID=UPI00349F3DB1